MMYYGLTMGQVLKPLGQLFHGQFGLSLNLQLGQFPQQLTATQSAQHRLPCLGETTEHKNSFISGAKSDTVLSLVPVTRLRTVSDVVSLLNSIKGIP